ncbi:MAG: hypothetical protein J6038_02195 [Bacilli bacterium]|nr:hypothetical protein [Bacilli bacterium]
MEIPPKHPFYKDNPRKGKAKEKAPLLRGMILFFGQLAAFLAFSSSVS